MRLVNMPIPLDIPKDILSSTRIIFSPRKTCGEVQEHSWKHGERSYICVPGRLELCELCPSPSCLVYSSDPGREEAEPVDCTPLEAAQPQRRLPPSTAGLPCTAVTNIVIPAGVKTAYCRAHLLSGGLLWQQLSHLYLQVGFKTW